MSAGPVDPNWIENLNSVLDENKILTLANGDRLNMSVGVKLIFEPQNVDNASPATVSRCGMVYMSSDGLDWYPMLESWIKKTGLSREETVAMANIFTEYFSKIYKWSSANLRFVMNVLQVHMLHTVFVLLESMMPSLNSTEEKDMKFQDWRISPFSPPTLLRPASWLVSALLISRVASSTLHQT